MMRRQCRRTTPRPRPHRASRARWWTDDVVEAAHWESLVAVASSLRDRLAAAVNRARKEWRPTSSRPSLIALSSLSGSDLLSSLLFLYPSSRPAHHAPAAEPRSSEVARRRWEEAGGWQWRRSERAPARPIGTNSQPARSKRSNLPPRPASSAEGDDGMSPPCLPGGKGGRPLWFCPPELSFANCRLAGAVHFGAVHSPAPSPLEASPLALLSPLLSRSLSLCLCVCASAPGGGGPPSWLLASKQNSLHHIPRPVPLSPAPSPTKAQRPPGQTLLPGCSPGARMRRLSPAGAPELVRSWHVTLLTSGPHTQQATDLRPGHQVAAVPAVP